MVFARNEMEYLGLVEGSKQADQEMINEMWHRLDALRCHDQEIDTSDWRPNTAEAHRLPHHSRNGR